MNWTDNFIQDVRFGSRVLIQQPIALTAAMAALALGIGLVTFMFCMLNGSLLRRLPLEDPDRLVFTTIPAGLVREFSEQQTAFDGLVAFGAFPAEFRAAAQPARRSVCFVTENFLRVLRAKPELGRDFLPGEGAAGAQPVALLSQRLWQEEFQGGPDVLGATVWVEGQPKTVIGVMPANFRFPINQDVWVAAEVDQQLANRGDGFVFGRLEPSVSIRRASADANTVAARLFRPLRHGGPGSTPFGSVLMPTLSAAAFRARPLPGSRHSR